MKLLILLMVIVSMNAQAQSSGETTFELGNYENEGYLTITGETAKTIWLKMTDVYVMPKNQFNKNDTKMTPSLSCVDHDGAHQAYSCYLKFSNLKDGILHRTPDYL